MEESYCGRICSECKRKEEIQCYGCKTETINHLHNDCEFAKCAFEKGLESCKECGNREACKHLKTREEMPEYHERQERELFALHRDEKEKKLLMARRAPFLGKWLWPLFWLMVPTIVANLMRNSRLAGYQAFYLLGVVLAALSSVAYSAFLIRASKEDRQYRSAGLCYLAATALYILGAFPLLRFVSYVAAVVEMGGMYDECMGHAAVLEGIDDTLSAQWKVLWKWYVRLFGGVFACLIVVIFLPILENLALLAVMVGSIVIVVWKQVYLYRTAKVFRRYIVWAE